MAVKPTGKVAALLERPIRFWHPTAGGVEIDFSLEEEFKLAVEAVGPRHNHEHIPANALWSAYTNELARDWRRDFGRPIKRVGDGIIEDILPGENKSTRVREFQSVWRTRHDEKDKKWSGHPDGIEIRRERLTTMIKIAFEDQYYTPVLTRMEIRIRQQRAGLVGFSRIPDPFGRRLSKAFQSKSERFEIVRTDSQRLKHLIPVMFEWNKEALVIEYEPARDLAVATSIAGHKRNITEFEGEVKGVYLLRDWVGNRPVNLKYSPQVAGWTQTDISQLGEAFLKQQHMRMVMLSLKVFDQKKFEGCSLEDVRHSKSYPETKAVQDLLEQMDRKTAMARIDEARRRNAFDIDPVLNEERLKRQSRLPAP